MLTAKGKYGLKALVYLAGLKAGATAQATEIARDNSISKKFLDAILAQLRSAGIVESKRGPGGGYLLARSPRLITAGHVIRTLDGPLAPIACASRTAYKPCKDCKSVQKCEVRRAMSLVRDATATILDRLSIADMSRIKIGASAFQSASGGPRRSMAKRRGSSTRLKRSSSQVAR